LGLIVNELALNAMKHAFPAGHEVIRLEVRRLGGVRAQIVAVDDGIGAAAASTATRGSGMGATDRGRALSPDGGDEPGDRK